MGKHPMTTPSNEIPSSYANKLSPTTLTKANFRKIENNFPNDADFMRSMGD